MKLNDHILLFIIPFIFLFAISCSDLQGADPVRSGAPSAGDTSFDGSVIVGGDADIDADNIADTEECPCDGETPTPVDTDNMVAVHGPAAHLVIDGSVHSGYPWGGKEYEGLRGEVFEFRMADYPVTWAIAAVHSAMLFQSRGYAIEPNTIIAMALRMSGLNCTDPALADAGCFQLNAWDDYRDLTLFFPENFQLPHARIISGNQFESSALALFFHWLSLDAMFGVHTRDSQVFFANHQDDDARLKTLLAAEKEGIWWGGITHIFDYCSDRDVLDCFYDQAITIDHVQSILHYTSGLNAAEAYDPMISPDDLMDYFDAIQSLYPTLDVTGMEDRLHGIFLTVTEGSVPVSFQDNIRELLIQMMTWLPPIPSDDEILQRVCNVHQTNMIQGICEPAQ